jgi:protein-tyrosine phosphatase
MHYLVDEAGLGGHIEIDSAGTAAYHTGERADSRSREAAQRRGIRLESIARQARPEDFHRFDYILAMDRSNHDELARIAPGDDALDRLHMFRSFDPDSAPGAGVPDPYYGGARGFDEVLDICEAACRGLLDHLVQTHGLPR